MRRTRKRVRIALATALVAVAAPWLASPAQAAELPVEDATFTWKISEHAWTSSSLSPSHATTRNATKVEEGFRFGEGSGTYDPESGELDVAFDGSVTLGNVIQGGYRIILADPSVTVDGSGIGALSADISYCISACDAPEPSFAGPERAVVVTFDTEGPTEAGTTLTWAGTPDPEAVTVGPAFAGALQFPQSFMDAIGPSTPSLEGHFRQTNAGGPEHADNLAKLPAPFVLSLSATPTTTTTEPTTTTTEATTTTTTTEVTTTTTEAPGLTDGTIVGGAFEWGFRESFRSYILSPVAGGSIEVEPPAVQGPDNGPFTFPLVGEGSYSSLDDLAAAFGGGVHFQGHAGVLDLEVSDPEVIVEAGEATLFVDTPDDQDVPLATLVLDAGSTAVSGQTVTVSGVPVVLTAEGAAALTSESGEGGYEEGQVMDPATLVLDVEGDLSGVPTTPVDPSTGKVTCTPTGTVAAGSTVQVCGKGFLAGEQVRILLHSAPVQIGVVTADADGAVVAQVAIPAATVAGEHRIELRGVSSGRSIFSDPFTIRAAGRDALPRTGGDADTLLRLATGMLAAGVLAAGAARRRRLTTVDLAR